MIKIGIVEDEVVIAELLKVSLTSCGYEVLEPASNYTEAIKMINTQQPDLVILDIHLAGIKDGIDLGDYINNEYKIPFIFLTAFSDKETVERAKHVNPSAYLVKPFKQEELFTTIEICLNNFNNRYTAEKHTINDKAVDDKNSGTAYVFIKEGVAFQKIFIDDILYLESEHVYVTIKTKSKKHLIRTAMKDFLVNLDPGIFIRIHKSYVVNVNHIQSVDSQNVKINDVKLPLSKNHKDELFAKLGLT